MKSALAAVLLQQSSAPPTRHRVPQQTSMVRNMLTCCVLCAVQKELLPWVVRPSGWIHKHAIE
jgi:hypothetical protein